MQTGMGRDRGIALAAVLLWHAMVGWWLLQTLHLDEVPGDENALQIVYVDRPSPPRPVRVVATHHPVRISRVAPAMRETQIVAATSSRDTSPPATARTLSAVFLDQARLAASHESGAVAQHAFDSPSAELPGAGSQHFRMRSQITPQSALVWVSKHLFYPPGYAADPCPRNNQNIGNLMASGDSTAMQQEVEFERAHCRP